ncbi:MAG: succinate dehydrogenase, hydrophobic membrane anchor protein [Gammaproteobacteria bacterium]|nr:succinate dehydrogenase, hydrophobic membrane anchor protein [Gammaproteobacteria bacterium]
MTYQAKGLQAWFLQRVSAVFMACYIIFFIWLFLSTDQVTYPIWLNWFSQPLMNIATGLFLIQLVIHAWIGMRDVILDYIPNDALRLFTLTCIGFFLIASSLEMLRILFSLSFNV